MLNCQKDKFSLPEEVSYLNNAYMSPLLRRGEEKGMESLLRKRNPADYNMDHFFKTVQDLKDAFGKLIHASSEQTCVIPSVSYGMSTLTRNLVPKKDGEIIVIAESFPSIYYPWETYAKQHGQHLKVIQIDKSKTDWAKRWNEKIIESINEKTTVIAMPHVHWADGTLFDLASIREVSSRHKTYMIIDGTQSVGALPLYIDEIKVDALIVGGYKWLLGHYGLGLAYYAPTFNDGSPIEENWINKKDSHHFQHLVDYKDQYKKGSARYSMGEQSNFILVPILLEGILQILEWGVENIQHYCVHLHNHLCNQLYNTNFNVSQIGESSSHLTGIRISPSMDINKIKEALTEEKIYVSYRGDAIRTSMYLYNDKNDIDRFTKLLTSFE